MEILRELSLPLDCFLGDAAAERLLRHTVACQMDIMPEEISAVVVKRRSVDARRKADVHFVATLEVYLVGEEPAPDRLPSEESLSFGHASSEPPSFEVPQPGSSQLELSSPEMSQFESRLSKSSPSDTRPFHSASSELPAPLSPSPSATDQHGKRNPLHERPLVVGSGPAGLFAALTLAEAGLRPLVLERGASVGERTELVRRFMATGILDTECNVQFGEGGAGTFSDGKLTTGTHSPLISTVLDTFVQAGAPEEIRIDAKPHIGTDNLVTVVGGLRARIEALGGEFRFRTRLDDLVFGSGGELEAVQLTHTQGEGQRSTLPARALILATGHSARSTFKMLQEHDALLEPKPFSMGVRIEHSQHAVDVAQYHGSAGHPALGAAAYKFVSHLPSGRSAYSFCMCPGGEVIAAASEHGGVVTNGMSRFARDGANANAGLLVNVGISDFLETESGQLDTPVQVSSCDSSCTSSRAFSGALAGVHFQQLWEQAAFAAGGGAFRAPAQLLGDFLQGVPSSGPGSIEPSYTRGVRYTDLSTCLPPFVVAALREAVQVFDTKMKFASPDAVLTGVETRSSSPVRIVRDAKTMCSSLRGVYPCGEGAGYAGGIVSSAVDGIRVAQALIETLRG